MSWTSLSIASWYGTEPALAIRNCVPTSRSPACGVENSSAGVAGSATLVRVTARVSPSERPLTVWVSPTPSPAGADDAGPDADGADVAGRDADGAGGAGALLGGTAGECGVSDCAGACAGAGVAEGATVGDGPDAQAANDPADDRAASTASNAINRNLMLSPRIDVGDPGELSSLLHCCVRIPPDADARPVSTSLSGTDGKVYRRRAGNRQGLDLPRHNESLDQLHAPANVGRHQVNLSGDTPLMTVRPPKVGRGTPHHAAAV